MDASSFGVHHYCCAHEWGSMVFLGHYYHAWPTQNYWHDEIHTAFESLAASSPLSCHQVLSELPRTSAGCFFLATGFHLGSRAKVC